MYQVKDQKTGGDLQVFNRGFDEKSIDRSTKKVYTYLDENLDNIRKDVDD